MREGFLRLDKKEGQIVNAFGEVLFVRRKRDGAEVYKAPSTETEICSHVAPKEVWVCVEWEGSQCRSWEECSSRKVIEVEICVDFAIAEPGHARRGPWRPIEGVATLRP